MENYLYQDLYSLEKRHWWHLAKRKTVGQLLKEFVAHKNIKILDIGCGTGENLHFFSKFGQVWGVDVSQQAVNYCKKRGLTHVKIAASDQLPFSQKSFDVVTLLDVLEHVEEKPTLHQIAKILKPKGILIITVPAYPWLWSSWDKVLHHKRRYTKASLTTALQQNGFQVRKISYLYAFLVIPAKIIRLMKSVFSVNTSYSSDFKLSSPLINRIFLKITDWERLFALRYSLPFGTSIICLAVKPK